MKLIEVTFELPRDSYNHKEENFKFLKPSHVSGELEIKTEKIQHRFVRMKWSMSIESNTINTEIGAVKQLNRASIDAITIVDIN